MDAAFSGIAVEFNHQPESISLYAILRHNTEVTVELRRLVAELGLTLGAVFNVRCEARIASQAPSFCSAVFRNANK